MLGEAADVVPLLLDKRERLALLHAVAQRIPSALVAPAAAAARAHLDEVRRAYALSYLAARATPEARYLLLQEAVNLARKTSGNQKAVLLADVADGLEGEERSLALREAVEASRAIHDELAASPVLLQLAKGLPQAELHRLLEQVRAMHDDGWKAHFLLNLTALLEEVDQNRILDEALTAGLSLRDPYRRYGALKALLPHLSDDGRRLHVFAEALETISDQPDDQARSHALLDLAPDMPIALLQDALTVARQIGEPKWKIQALIRLLPRIPFKDRQGLSEEALSSIETMAEDDQAWAITHLVAHLADPLLPRVLSMVQTLVRGGSPGLFGRVRELFAEVLSRMPSTSAPELAELARNLSDQHQRPEVLAVVASAAPEPLCDALRKEAVDAALLELDPTFRARALVALLDDLEPEARPRVVAQALQASLDERNPALHAEDLFQLARHTRDGERTWILRKGLEALESITDEDSRAGNLIALALERAGRPGGLPDEALPGALETARAMKDDGRKAAALAALASRLDAQSRAAVSKEALRAALSAASPKWQAKALASLLPLLSDENRVTALVAALRVYPHCDDFLARKSLDDSIKGLPDGLLLGVGTSHQTLHELWSGMLRGTIHNRDECLKGLQSVADLATKIGGESTAASTARAFIDVCDWFS